MKGIFIWEIEHKIPQYADDTEIMLKGHQESSDKKIKASGLFSNAGKTSAIWLSSRQTAPVKYIHISEWNGTHLNSYYLVSGSLMT